MYRHGLQAGRILTDGTPATDPIADDPTLLKYRVYRTRPDISPSTGFAPDIEVRLDAEEVAFIGRYGSVTAQQLFDVYDSDWSEWPANDGALFKDMNGNGIFEPSIDIPGMPDADQTLWYIANDLDTMRVQSSTACPPIGLEVQRTIWGYRNRGLLDNVVFVQTKLINRSGASIDSMFVSQWSDPDLGFAGDDFVGCDTTRDLGYAYNGKDIDEIYGRRVPAVGYALLDGPQTPSPANVARAGLRTKIDHRNLRMSAFSFFMSGWFEYSDPTSGPGLDTRWYRVMNGFPANAAGGFVDPGTGQPTRFLLAGDPVTGSGWIDGGPLVPSDRRMILSSGPFTMAPGDTQVVVLAFMVGDGPDRIASIRSLRYVTDLAHTLARNLFQVLPPKPQVHVTYANASNASANIVADNAPHTALSILAELLRADGSSAGRVDLYDDGTHGDLKKGDGVWENTITVGCERDPVGLSLAVTDSLGNTVLWTRVIEPVSICGPLTLSLLPLFSDNINGDRQANPGENIRFGVGVTNGTAFDISKISVYLDSLLWPDIEPLDVIASGATAVMQYDPGNSQTYLATSVPSSQSGGHIALGITVLDDRGNRWKDTVRIPVHPFAVPPTSTLLKRTGGLCDGDFGIRIVDPSQVKNHLYVISGIDSISPTGETGFTLTDSTDGRVLIENHAVPDSLGHSIPVTDGFKIIRGSIDTVQASAGWSVPHGAQAWSSTNGVSFLPFDCFDGAIGSGTTYPGGSSVRNSQFHSVLIKFAACNGTWDPQSLPSDPDYSRGYRYVRSATSAPAKPEFAPWILNKTEGYAYQDYNYSVPFSAWDVDMSPPMRLSVGHLENNVTAGRVDGRYWPPSVSENLNNGSSVREWFFVFSVPYSESAVPELQRNAAYTSDSRLPMMWIGSPTRMNTLGFTGDEEFLILAHHPLATGDQWAFNPTSIVAVEQESKLTSFLLEQNYPNPFNPSTVVRYRLPVASNVRLVIYDLLGREVAVLVDGKKEAGTYEVKFDGTRLSSGVYFFRLQAGDFVQTRRLMLLK